MPRSLRFFALPLIPLAVILVLVGAIQLYNVLIHVLVTVFTLAGHI